MAWKRMDIHEQRVRFVVARTDARSRSGRTPLALWLIRQRIRLCWSGIQHPQTQGKVERFHGSLQRVLDRCGSPAGDPQAWLDAFRTEYNQMRPHEALGMQSLWWSEGLKAKKKRAR